jgi:hypothetical protein
MRWSEKLKVASLCLASQIDLLRSGISLIFQTTPGR